MKYILASLASVTVFLTGLFLGRAIEIDRSMAFVDIVFKNAIASKQVAMQYQIEYEKCCAAYEQCYFDHCEAMAEIVTHVANTIKLEKALQAERAKNILP